MPIHLFTDYLSIFVGMELYYLLNNNILPSNKKIPYIIAALIGALIGSRLLGALEDPMLFFHPQNFLYYYVNKTIIGGIAGGIIGIELMKRYFDIRPNTGDSVVIPLVVAIIIGRIGCQITGVSDGTIGVPCDYFWCFQQGDEFTRHPIPLYEIIELVLFLPLFYYWIKIRRFKGGFVFRLFVITYFGFRFFFEFLKDVHPLIFSLSAIQLVCLLFVFYYLFDSIKNGLYKPNSN